MNPTIIYTLGHSTLQIGSFKTMLREARIERLVDVRYRPQSRRPWFNRSALEERFGALYVFEGEALGNPAHFGAAAVGRAAYSAAIDRLIERAQGELVAIMCAEAHHVKCHRATVIGESLRARGVTLCHLRLDSTGEIAKTFVPAKVEA